MDERARHPGVWNTFVRRLQQASSDSAETTQSVRILEIGGGVGDLAILILRALREQSVEYTLVDIEPENLKAARERLASAFPDASISNVCDGFKPDSEAASIGQTSGENDHGIRVQLIHEDVTNASFVNTSGPPGTEHYLSYDAICGQAIMDIVPSHVLLHTMGHLLDEEGLMYLPINFDGRTDIEPVYYQSVDQRVSDVYHASMMRTWTDAQGNRHSYNGARSGRDLIMHAAAADLSVVDAGASDWIVLPLDQQEGSASSLTHTRSQPTELAEGGLAENDRYPAEEAYFLTCMLHFIEEELEASDHLSRKETTAWLNTRRRQLRDGELALFVHNLDILLSKAD